MQCPSCGAENMEGAPSCWECGAAFGEVRQRARGGWLVWVLLGVGAVVLAGMLLTAGQGGVAGGGGSVESTASVSATATAESTATTSAP